MTRPICLIAREIHRDWNPRIAYEAAPYLEAMSYVSSIDDHFGADSARSVILYFLSNARSWQGSTARRVKSELKTMLRTTGAAKRL